MKGWSLEELGGGGEAFNNRPPHSVRRGRLTSGMCEISQILDFFSLFPVPCKLESHKFSELYEKHKLSLKQISEKMGVSKNTVLKKLKGSYISRREKGEAQTNPKNYRSPNPPFGFKVVDGRLVENKSEIRICKKVLVLSDEDHSFRAISKILTDEGFKNRKNTTYWCHKQLKRVYNHWKEKL